MASDLEFYLNVTGWALFFLSALLLYFIMAFTPATQFLRAKWKKVPLFLDKYKDTFGEFKEGAKQKKDYTLVEGLPVHIANNSQIIEKKSKVPIYLKFAGHGINTNVEYAAVIQELNDQGFEINRIEDLIHIIKLTKDEEYKKAHLENFTDEKEKKAEEELITKLKKVNIEISPYKTYTLPDLRNMFPFNINSDFMDGIVEEEVNIAIKRKKKNDDLMKWMLMGGVVISMLIIAAMIYFTMVDIPDKKIICDCLNVGVKAAADSIVA